MRPTQFNLKTVQHFGLDRINELEYDTQQDMDETLDALATVTKNHQNHELIREATKRKYTEFAKRHNAETQRACIRAGITPLLERWPLGI